MTLILNSDTDELERLSAFIDEFCDSCGLADETRYHLNIALEELVLNAMKHGRCDPAGEAIRLEMTMDGETLQISYSDTGVPFNPLAMPEPDLSRNIAERPIGGLGIHLVRSLMEDIRYERREGRNHLHLAKHVALER